MSYQDRKGIAERTGYMVEAVGNGRFQVTRNGEAADSTGKKYPRGDRQWPLWQWIEEQHAKFLDSIGPEAAWKKH